MFESGRQLDWDFDPLEALARWPSNRRAVLLHSGRFDARWATRSILAEPVGTYLFGDSRPHLSRWIGPADRGLTGKFRHKPFADLRCLLECSNALWVGYLSYDLGRWIERAAQGPDGAVDDRVWPIMEFACCPGFLVYDLKTGRWTACGRYARSDPPDLSVPPVGTAGFVASEPKSVLQRGQYEAAVVRALDYIAAGDVFQVCLTQRFTAEFDGLYPSAQRHLYQRLAHVSPAWYGAYLELEDRRVIASTSPELFLRADEAGRVITRPIKGTRPASVSANVLRRSEKDTAELNMIVDLMRNDLGRVCGYGSISVTEPRVIESHPTVHHGVAAITGRLHRLKDRVDLLRATLPGGSVTGAPKIRAMQIIDELEPVRRGPYCGSIGFLTRDTVCLNIAIRTMLLDTRRRLVDFSVGGGIVADSNPSAEYAETIDKARAIFTALDRSADLRSTPPSLSEEHLLTTGVGGDR